MSPAAKALELVLRQAPWMGKGKTPATLSVVAPMTPMPSPPVQAKPVAIAMPEPSARIEGTIVLRTETTTIVADADGVIVEEIEHGLAEPVVVVEPPPVEPPVSTTPMRGPRRRVSMRPRAFPL